MVKDIICFTPKGRAIIDKLNNEAQLHGIAPANVFECFGAASGTLDKFVKSGFAENHALIFVGATGIAVRAVSPYVADKMSDSPVVVIDDAGQFVIPILSGHVGGANKLAIILARLIGAIPVITTSTDVNGAFSVDVFAEENHLTIKNREGIRKVSAKAIEGKPVTISIKDYPPKDKVDITIADETDAEYTLLLSPKKYTIGIGLKKDRDPDDVEKFIFDTLNVNNINICDVYAVCTIDIKQDEPAIVRFCSKYRIPLITFEAPVLARCEGDFTSSEFVKETVGVDNVCERAALLGAGSGGSIYMKRQAYEGMTVAIAKRR